MKVHKGQLHDGVHGLPYVARKMLTMQACWTHVGLRIIPMEDLVFDRVRKDVTCPLPKAYRVE